MTEEQINRMVNRFLAWRLPKPFRPDGGISYTPPNYTGAAGEHHWPTGTNLFDVGQTKEMVRFMAEGIDTE